MRLKSLRLQLVSELLEIEFKKLVESLHVYAIASSSNGAGILSDIIMSKSEPLAVIEKAV
jgi:hypothetical protein